MSVPSKKKTFISIETLKEERSTRYFSSDSNVDHLKETSIFGWEGSSCKQDVKIFYTQSTAATENGHFLIRRPTNLSAPRCAALKNNQSTKSILLR